MCHIDTRAEDSDTYVPTKRLKGRQYREVAEASLAAELKAEAPKQTKSLNGAKPVNGVNATSATSSFKQDEGTSSPSLAKKPAIGPSGMIMEVVLTPRPSSQSAQSSSAEAVRVEANAPRSARRATKKRIITISSDEDESKDAGSDFKPEASPPPPSESEGAPSARPSDDEGFSEGNAASEDEESAVSTGSEADKPKKKGKAKVAKQPARARKTTKRKIKVSDDDGDMMDEDGEDTGAADSDSSINKKRKAKNDGNKAAKKARKEPKKEAGPRREASDPWKLQTRDVREDWRDMKCPTFEMFHFARKVIDEYTYLDGYSYEVVTSLTADCHWVLSGTPPTHDFASVKTIARFLDVHLGIDDDSVGMSELVKKRRKEQTGM